MLTKSPRVSRLHETFPVSDVTICTMLSSKRQNQATVTSIFPQSLPAIKLDLIKSNLDFGSCLAVS